MADEQYDASLKRDRAIERLRDEILVAQHNLSPNTDPAVLDAVDDLLSVIDDAVRSQTGPSKAEVKAQEEADTEAKRPR